MSFLRLCFENSEYENLVFSMWFQSLAPTLKYPLIIFHSPIIIITRIISIRQTFHFIQIKKSHKTRNTKWAKKG